MFNIIDYKNKSRISTPIILIGVGISVYIPKILNYLFEILNVNIDSIPYLKDVLNSGLYNSNFMEYSKHLITAGMQNYIKESVKQDAEISK